MKVLLLGGAGFIGSYLTRELIDQGHQVAIIDNGMESFGYAKIAVSRNKLLEGSTFIGREIGYLSQLVMKNNYDVIVHLAALPLEKEFDSQTSKHQLSADILTTYDAVTLAKQMPNTKFVYMSSLFAYGNYQYGTSEDRALNPITAYGMSKAIGEQMVVSQLQNYNIIRTTSVYGFGDVHPRATNTLLSKAMKREPAEVNDVWLDFIYVKDLAKGIVEVLTSQHNAEAFHISGGRAERLQSYAELVKLQYPMFEYNLVFEQDRPLRGTLDNSKAKQLLDWEPIYTLAEGFADYMTYVNKYGHV